MFPEQQTTIMPEILKDIIIAIIAALGGGGATSLYNRKANRNSIEIDNQHKIILEYQSYIEELKKQNCEIREERDEYRDQVGKLWDEIHALNRKVSELELALAKK